MIALFLVTGALAWGQTGHRAVGLIAERHAAPATLRALRALMGDESLARASTWPDEKRSDAVWTAANPDAWRDHFINAEPEGTLAASRDAQPRNIWTALERWEAVLADPSQPAEARRDAVRWLAHLVGDAHQPLHAGRESDRGGNTVDVRWFGTATNLHALWDEHLIAHTALSYTELVAFIDHPSPAEVAAWRAGTAADWLAESRALLPALYEVGEPANPAYAYHFAHWPTVERRLVQAGVRLAATLDRALGRRAALSAPRLPAAR